ncbi:MAG: alkaline phosphatase [Anaerolineae bacterium]|nr:alkaline phosphatase [Anaerolineae bacterium]
MAAAYLAAEQPDLCVIYMGNIDEIGHRDGWMSAPYREAIAQGDRAIGRVLAALDGAGLRARYALLVQADHGGHERDHSAGAPEDLTIPWVLSGPGVKRNHRIQTPVMIYDTAATIAHLLDLPRPAVWDGQPVYDALD